MSRRPGERENGCPCAGTSRTFFVNSRLLDWKAERHSLPRFGSIREPKDRGIASGFLQEAEEAWSVKEYVHQSCTYDPYGVFNRSNILSMCQPPFILPTEPQYALGTSRSGANDLQLRIFGHLYVAFADLARSELRRQLKQLSKRSGSKARRQSRLSRQSGVEPEEWQIVTPKPVCKVRMSRFVKISRSFQVYFAIAVQQDQHPTWSSQNDTAIVDLRSWNLYLFVGCFWNLCFTWQQIPVKVKAAREITVGPEGPRRMKAGSDPDMSFQAGKLRWFPMPNIRRM